MIRRLIAVILFINIHFFSISQQVLVKDESTGKPIADVFVYHENEKYISHTNREGMADLSSFDSGEVFLQHPSYFSKSFIYSQENIEVFLKEKIISFNEVIVSSNKWEQSQASVSQQILSINKKTIEFQNPQTSADLLSRTGQVFVQKSQLGGGSPKIRGFAANAVLLVVDGVRMNNAIFRSGNLQNVINIDPNALESSEVIFGPGSVIYGSDALGGVMDFHTISPNWSPDNQLTIKGNGMIRYSSAAKEQTGHLDFSVARKGFTFFHSTTYTSFDDLRSGSYRSGGYEGEFERTFYTGRIDGQDRLIKNDNVNIQRHSGYSLFSSINKLKFRVGQHADISYGFYYSNTSDIPRYDNLTQTSGTSSDSLRNAAWFYGPQKWQMHNLRINYYQSNPLFDQAKLTLAYQDFLESRNDRRFGDERLRKRTEQVDMYSISLDFDKELNKANIYYGLDFYHNKVTSDAFRRNIITDEITETDSRYPDGGSNYTSMATYISLVKELSDKLIINAGFRLNNFQLNAITTNERALANNSEDITLNNTALNGSLGVTYRPSPVNKLSYNLSTGFRAPNIDDVGKVFDIGNRLVVPNPNLEPEYTVSNELAFEHQRDAIYFKAVTFYSRLVDAIVDGPFTLNGSETIVIDGQELDIGAKVNAGKAVLYGASLSFVGNLKDTWAFTKTISYTGGRDLTNNQPLRHTTPVFGRAGLTYQKKKIRSEFYVEYNTSLKVDQIPLTEIEGKPHIYTDEGSPGWYTLNIISSYQLIEEKLKVNFGIENILDKHYRPYTSGISAPGRNFLISLKASI